MASLPIRFQNFFNSRRLLLHTASSPASAQGPAPLDHRSGYDSFDANVVMVLSVLLCAVVFSLGLNAIMKCAFRCWSLLSLSMNNSNFPTARLVRTGVRQKALKRFPTVEYSNDVKIPSLDSECVICLAEFEPGERLRLLPKCFHGFHVQCIDKWLITNTSCPKCRNCLTETCRKIVGCREAVSSSAPAESSSVVDIAPLERETLICNYRESR